MNTRNKKMTLDILAGMVAVGFENTPTKSEMSEVKSGIAVLKNNVQTLQTDVSDIKLRLDYLAPKFEVKDLEKRVIRLEEKTGLRRAA